jgi:hypothetical protein
MWGVCVQQSHFADEHVDRRHDEISLVFGKESLI